MSTGDIGLYAHLMRRAGFGGPREDIEQLALRPYEEVVEDLLNPEKQPDLEYDLINRFGGAPGWDRLGAPWLFRMVNSGRPLVEKMTLFWHHIFATAGFKSGWHVLDQIDMFRRVCLSDLRNILVELSKDTAMINWLDNNQNFADEPNENYGRELLELFSMGVGNYTEADIKACSRAFTGWTFAQMIPGNREGGYLTRFVYNPDDHDDSVKTFLGETGRFNGEDIVDIIVRQPATARFIARHMYTFFVADEPPVSAWNEIPPQDPKTIEMLVDSYFESNADIRRMLRVLFTSDAFKEARYKRVKSPPEYVTGVMHLVGAYRKPFPDRTFGEPETSMSIMGQSLMNPLTVEGWQTGRGWIDGGTLNERVNFAVDELSDPTKPGVRKIVERLAADGGPVSPDEFVNRVLDLAGPVPVNRDTWRELHDYAQAGGPLSFESPAHREGSEKRVVRMLQLVVSAREYQLG